MKIKKVLVVVLGLFCLGTLLTACNYLGKKPTVDQLTEITAGVTTKEQAIQILGRPERQYLNNSTNELIMSYNSGAFFLLIGPDGKILKKVLGSGQEL